MQANHDTRNLNTRKTNILLATAAIAASLFAASNAVAAQEPVKVLSEVMLKLRGENP